MKRAAETDPRDRHVTRIAALDLVYAPQPWHFAEDRRAAIDAHFADLRRATPELWNGRVLLMHSFGIRADTFHGAYLQTDFASFIAWRDWDFPDTTMHNCFAMGALRGADGGFVLGRMADHTANAGRVYFPCGTPEPDDIVDGRVDLAGSIRREVLEETGLDADAYVPQDSWYTVFAGPRIAQVQVLQSPEPADMLRARILGHLAGEAQPELADICVVHSPDDFAPQMPPFVTAFLNHIWTS